MQETLPMSLKQLNRLDILQRALRRELTQKQAGDLLNVKDRTVRRQLIRLGNEGPSFLQHGLKAYNGLGKLDHRIREIRGTIFP